MRMVKREIRGEDKDKDQEEKGMIGLLLDIGNIIFFISNLPQLITAYRNRRDLKGLSSRMLIGYFIATLFFGSVAFLTGGYITFVLCIINEVIFITQAHWKRKYRKGGK